MRSTRTASPLLLALLLLASPLPAQQSASPAAQGVDSLALARAYAHAARLPQLRSLLVARHGRLVGERYYHGATAATHFNVKSASKSVLSALVGIAVREGHLRGLDQPALGFFPELARAPLDARKRRITVRHLLTMTSGLESTSFGAAYGRWVQSPDWVRYAWERPLTGEPGSVFDYSTGSTHLLSAILTRATGTSTLAYANRYLFHPLGIRSARWARDPQGVYFGGNDMYLTARDLLRFGQLYLDGGVHQGRQLVPAEWVEASRRPVGRSRFSGDRYGYGWWLRSFAGHPAYFAWGYGGQYVFNFPDLDLVVVMTCSDRSPTRKDELYDLLENRILPAVRPGSP